MERIRFLMVKKHFILIIQTIWLNEYSNGWEPLRPIERASQSIGVSHRIQQAEPLDTALPTFYFFSFEYSSLIDFPCKNILYELLMIRSSMASATGPLPSFSNHPSGVHWEQRIVDFLFVRFSITSRMSFRSDSLTDVKRNSSMINKSIFEICFR